MVMCIDQRPADIALVDSIWQASSKDRGEFISSAAIYWELVVTGHGDTAPVVTLRGPATRTTPLAYGSGGRWWGIRFRIGARFPHIPGGDLVDQAISLPVTSDRTFGLLGRDIHLPNYDNAEATARGLIDAGLLVTDPLVDAAWNGSSRAVSQRSLQRRFQHATGLSQRTARQITRARTALRLLQQGTSIADAVFELGYCDQAHLTRSLRRWTGMTPAQVLRNPQSTFMA